MKKVSLFLSLMLISILAFSQVVPTEVLRIANATTAMGVNISVGKLVYDINADLLYVANAAVVHTLTLTSGSANFTLVSSTGGGDQDLSYTAGTHTVEITNGNNAIIPLAVDDGATEGLASFAAADFDATAGNIAIDYANGQKVSTSHPGFATAALYDSITANTAKIGVTDGDKGDITVSATGATWSIDNSAVTEAKIDDDAVTNDKISTGAVTYDKMQVVAADQRILGNVSGASEAVAELTATQVRTMLHIEDGAEANFTLFTEKFEETSGTATEHSLAETAQTAGATVSLNGSMLDPANYTLTSSTLEIDIAVLQYDIVVVTYNY